MALVPTFTATVDQNFLVDRFGGSQNPLSLLDRFPDEVYSKAPESHLVKFMYALLGPAGVGWLLQSYLELRLQLGANGIDLFDLEGFYGDPFRFGRILEELYDQPPDGLLDRADWDKIRAQDERYRSRALDFFNGARAGNTLLGLQLAAKSGLGHEVQIIENYKYLFSLHTDEPYPIDHFGGDKNEEFIVVPQREISRSSVQTITQTPLATASAGTFTLTFRGAMTAPLAYNSLATDVQAALEALPTIGSGNVAVAGGPIHLVPLTVTFQSLLSNQPVPTLDVASAFTPTTVNTIVVQTVGGIESTDEAVMIPAADKHHLQVALDRIRPVHTIWSTFAGTGNRTRQSWNSALATSEYNEVVRYVTGNPAVTWPATDSLHWIEGGVEKPAPRASGDLQYHYAGFHDLVSITPYHDGALNDPNYLLDDGVLQNYLSEHQGSYNAEHLRAVPLLQDQDDPEDRLTGDRAAADYPEPLTVTSRTESNSRVVQLVNGVYPLDYLSLPGVPQLKYKAADAGHFWSSQERESGSEYLEIDLGDGQMVNFLAFEMTKKPISIEIAYDLLDQPPARKWQTVTPAKGFTFTDGVSFTPEETVAWYYVEYHFEDAVGNIPMTSRLRIRFERKSGLTEPFLYDITRNVQNPWSIEVRNLRVGRVVS